MRPREVKKQESKTEEEMTMATVPVRRGDPEAKEAGHLHVRRRRLPLLRAGGSRRRLLAAGAAASGHCLHAGLDDSDHLQLFTILGNLSITIQMPAQSISIKRSCTSINKILAQ
jgi:hypothetical protein